MTVAGVDCGEHSVILGRRVAHRARGSTVHRGDRAGPNALGVDVRMVGEHVALELAQDLWAPDNVERIERIERGEGEPHVAQRWRVEHTGVEHDPPRYGHRSAALDAGGAFGVGDCVDRRESLPTLLRVGDGIGGAHTTMRTGKVRRELAVDQANDERPRQAEQIGHVLRREVAILGQDVDDTAGRQVGEQLLDGSLRYRGQPDVTVTRPHDERFPSRQQRCEPLAVTHTEFEAGGRGHRSTDPKRHKRNLLPESSSRPAQGRRASR